MSEGVFRGDFWRVTRSAVVVIEFSFQASDDHRAFAVT
jgi:hypothetical protein